MSYSSMSNIMPQLYKHANGFVVYLQKEDSNKLDLKTLRRKTRSVDGQIGMCLQCGDLFRCRL